MPAEQSPFLAEARKRSKPVTAAAPQRGPELTVKPALARAAVRVNLLAYDANLPYTHYTARTVGKVFFTLGQWNFVCSGAIVKTEGMNAVWILRLTACTPAARAAATLRTGNSSRHMTTTFPIPRRDGRWTARRLVPAAGWQLRTDWNEDMGVALMNPQFGWRIADYLGGQGFKANHPRRYWQDVMGYPAAWPFDGGNLWRCSGNAIPRWRDEFAQQIEVPCHLTAGTSGAPWLSTTTAPWAT